MPENSPDPLLICISGGDGSGKSTQVAALEKQLTDRGIHTATAAIWDPFTDPFVAERLPFRTREDVFAYVRILGPGARGYFLFHWMRLAFDRALARSPAILLINAYWYKYFATEIAHGADPAPLRACTQGFPTPHHTFYLRITPETALSRKQDRSDYESGYGDEHTFIQFQHHSLKTLDALSQEFSWTPLDATLPPDELTTTILTALDLASTVAVAPAERITG
ncbi:dTMP kinase [Nocardia terpenica]|uniref:dTMP kinase n=1 Tax=Nocardia terpenica TaxID=455432 RepID=UPI0012FDE418|nr:hypothetical protein [Nocardia terpenica]